MSLPAKLPAHRPEKSWLIQLRMALLCAATLVTLPACQPQIIEVDRPVTRVVEKPVEIAVTRIVEKPVGVEVTRVVEIPVEAEVTRVVERPVEAEVTRVVEILVEVEVTRIVEKPVEVEVTRVVEIPVEVIVTRWVEESVEEGATPVPERANVAPLGSIRATAGLESRKYAIDRDPETFWSSGLPPVQSLQVTLDKFYLVDRIEMVVEQAPAGETTHQIWIGTASGTLTKFHEFTDVATSDGQTLSLELNPPRVMDRVMILTTKGPSWVAWSELRVFAESTLQPKVAGITADWPHVKVRGGLEMPVQITNAGDGSGRLFVVEQKGRIRVISDVGLLSTPFLDISEQVACCGEQGLLSVAFPPDYASKRHFYVNYTNAEGDTEIVRYRLSSDSNVADPDSAEMILRIDQPDAIHNGGHMAFGPKDGFLYIGSGDGGPIRDPDNRGQDPDTLLGKLLRIDVESGVSPYAIPEDNPFVHSDGYRSEIWALGLRNPWGFAFDSRTGDLFIGDVGEGEFEEINYQQGSSLGGENYGWSMFEGTHCPRPHVCDTTGLTQPIAEYPHSQGCAIIGGPVYRGSESISMQGIYFYADFCSGRIWGLRTIDGRWESALLYDAPFRISSIGEDEAGRLYITNYNEGLILALEGPTQAPEAIATAATKQ